MSTNGNAVAYLRSMRAVLGSLIFFMLLALVVLLFVPNSTTFIVAASIVMAGVLLVFHTKSDRSQSFTLLLGSLAFLLVAGCEVVFLKDVFAGSYPRMNSVFKFYFQAWALLSVASGAGLFFILEGFRPAMVATTTHRVLQRGVLVLWSALLLALLCGGLAYPLNAIYPRYAQFNSVTGSRSLQRANSLDGLSYLATDPVNSGDYAAIIWLNAHVSGNPTIVEANGPDYSNYGRVSIFTGLPTLMNWPGHEYQWRVNWLNNSVNMIEFQRRGADVDTIYSNSDSTLVLSIMARYNAQYLYVGPLEFQKYPNVDLHRFSKFMKVVYNIHGVTIYQVR
jgi:uncharacterized membrane protein